MYWKDEGFLLSKNNYRENSIIIEMFTLNHGKYTGIVYGGTSRKQKKNFQIGNKMLLHLKSKGENKMGYFNVELIKPVGPMFFDDKRKSVCVLAASSILKILLPERQINKKIYFSFNNLVDQFELDNWIKLYIYWEVFLIKELGFDINFREYFKSNNNANKSIEINKKTFKIPEFFFLTHDEKVSKKNIKEALIFNKNVLIQNFIEPNRLKMPLSRNLLERYYN